MALAARRVRVVRVHCPITAETLARIAGRSDFGAIERDPTASAILEVIRADNPLGDFGLYRGVFEVALGVEGFTATADARPTLGRAGADTLSPSAIITTYVDADAEPAAVDAALEALAKAHPWEIPVIELSEAILVRAG